MALTAHYVTATGTDTWANSTTYTTPCSLTTALANATAGDWVKVLLGTYTRTASDTFGGTGTLAACVIFQGFASFGPDIPSSAGERINGVGLLITTNMPVLAYDSTYGIETFPAYCEIQGISFTFNKNGAGVLLGTASSASNFMSDCSVVNVNNGSFAAAVQGYYGFNLVNCDYFLTGGGSANNSSVFTQSTPCYIMNCHVGNNSTGAASSAISMYQFGSVSHCTIYSSVLGVVQSTAGVLVVRGNTFYGCLVAFRDANVAKTVPNVFIDNIITDCGQVWNNPYHATSEHMLIRRNNRTRDNTNVDATGDLWPRRNAVTTDTGGAETDYANAATGDFRIIYASPAKSAALGGGDIGACQRAENTFPAAGNTLLASGTYGDVIAPTTPTLTLPAAGAVDSTTSTFGNPGSPVTPTMDVAGLVAAQLVTDEAVVAGHVGDIVKDVVVLNQTGTLDAYPLLNPDNVRGGTDLGNGTLGDLELPVITNVKTGVNYGANGTELTGTLNALELKFNLGDIAYNILDASKGLLIPLTIIDSRIQTPSLEVTEILYEIRNNQKFNKSEYEEGELLTYAEAKPIAKAFLESEISHL